MSSTWCENIFEGNELRRIWFFEWTIKAMDSLSLFINVEIQETLDLRITIVKYAQSREHNLNPLAVYNWISFVRRATNDEPL